MEPIGRLLSAGRLLPAVLLPALLLEGAAGAQVRPQSEIRSGSQSGTQTPAVGTPRYDILIRHGHIVDGTGSPWYSGDLAVRDGRIAGIAPAGTLRSADARQTIDAHGLIVAPGFIDMLGQSERTILTQPHVSSKLFQGITTEVTGEGSSIAPRSEAMLAANDPAANQPAVTPPSGVAAATPEFRTLADYFRRLEAQGIAINLATYVGAATVRRIVLGDEDRAPTPAELAQMQTLVRDAMHDGAMGVSTSLMYAPGVYARTPELIALASTAAESGGIYATHLRSEADGLLPAIDEAVTIGREAHIAVEIFHLKVAGPSNWGRMPEVIRRIEAARVEGVDIAADTYAYLVSGNPGSALLPPWVHDGGTAAMVGRLNDPATRLKIRDSILHDHTWDNEWFMVQSPAGITLAGTSQPALKPYTGQSFAAIALARHTDAIDTALDLLAADPRLSVLLATMSERDVTLALEQPWVSIGLDGWGTSPEASVGRHPRAFGTFPHVVRKYVREDRVLTLPDAIRKFSALPAARLHLGDRGVLKAGMWADVVVFDPATFADTATFPQPNQLAKGMQWVLVNGVPVIANGVLTDALPGRPLRGAGFQP
ncbi:MAG: D-aminoacylase [Acidobacteriota bacterium]|nr:D-aminoacylase [Acidobacteriota bacterium]